VYTYYGQVQLNLPPLSYLASLKIKVVIPMLDFTSCPNIFSQVKLKPEIT
jgi:hypothetical protein